MRHTVRRLLLLRRYRLALGRPDRLGSPAPGHPHRLQRLHRQERRQQLQAGQKK